MPWDLENLNPIRRFPWPESDKGEWVDLRLLPPGEQSVIAGAVKSGSLRADELPGATLEYLIVDWLIVTDDDRRIPCTPDAKAVMCRAEEFLAFLGDCLAEMLQNGERQ